MCCLDRIAEQTSVLQAARAQDHEKFHDIYERRNGHQTGQKVVTVDASLDSEIPLESGCRLVYICNAILITLRSAV